VRHMFWVQDFLMYSSQMFAHMGLFAMPDWPWHAFLLFMAEASSSEAFSVSFHQLACALMCQVPAVFTMICF
jgi:hypothetical protein